MNALRRGGWISSVLALAAALALISMGITEEVALGGLSGRVTMAENGLPIKRAFVTLSPAFHLDDTPLRSRTVETNERGEFSLRNVPVGSYTLEASAKAHSLEPTHVAIEEGAPAELELALTPEVPRLKLYNSQRVFMPNESPEIEAHGFGPEASLSISTYTVDLKAIAEAGSVQDLMYSFGEYSNQNKRPEEIGKLLQKSEHRIQNLDAEGTFIDALKVDPLPEGFYLMQVSYGKLSRSVFLNVSRIAVVTKSVKGEALCFVTDLSSGEPIADAEIAVSRRSELKRVGKTNGQGIATVALPAGDGETLLIAQHSSSTAAASFYPYGGDAASPHTVFAYTERPIYRPGDEVSFKGFVRKRQGNAYVLPGAGTAECEVRDPSGSVADSFTVSIRPNGAFDGRFSTSREATPGEYQLLVRAFGREEYVSVTLAAYRKPEFTIQVDWSKPFYAMGDRARATVRCTYYFGGPVVGANVTASVFRNPTWVAPPGDDTEENEWENDYSESYEGGFGLEDLKATTNERGEAVFEFATKHDKDKPPYRSDFTYTLYASVAEAGDKRFDGEGNVLVARGDFGVAIDTDRYVLSPGDPLKATVQTFSHVDGAPVSGRPVRVLVGTERWTGNDSVFTPRRELRATTGTDGRAIVDIPTSEAEGSFVIKAIAEDQRRRKIEAETWLWVEGGSGGQPKGKLTLALDKKQYKPGELAQALIVVDKPGGSALVTIEAERVLKSWVVPLKGKSTSLSIPVEASYLPRVSVAVARVVDKKFFEAGRPLKLDLAVCKLDIRVQGDKRKYLPGETATFTVNTATNGGKPAAAEISLALVDESIYAIQEDGTDPVSAFYPRRQNHVQTSYSFPELYLDGGDKGGGIPIRTNFKDTATWLPTVQTGSDGTATVTVKLPDNLTEWRMTAVGVTDDTHVGIGKGTIVASKPLMIRLQGPAFMVTGDRQHIAAIVNNDTGSDQQVEVRLRADGLATRDAAVRSVQVRNGGSASVEWDFNASRSGMARLQATARAKGGQTDGVEQKIPIEAHGREVRAFAAGDTKASGELSMVLRQDADPDAGALSISLSPTIAASLYQSLDELIGYPYGCTEQTMSRFVPTVALAEVPSVRSTLPQQFVAEIPKMVDDGLARLARMRVYDGGWGWWEYGESDPFMTAYVLDGLLLAKDAGYAVDAALLDGGLDRAVRMLEEDKSKPIGLRDRLYLAWALARGGRTDPGRALAKNLRIQGATPTTLASAVLLFASLGEDTDEALELLRASAVETSSLAHWPEEPNAWGYETTAVALRAIQAVSPNDSLVTKTIRYLLLNRQGDWWTSTRDTSFSIIAISAHLKAAESDESPGPFRAIVKLNGREVAGVDLDSRRRFDPKSRVQIPVKSLKSGANRIEIVAGVGRTVYYTADLRQVATAPRLGKLVSGPGFTLDRQYFLLRPTRQEDGSLRLLPGKDPVSRVRSGDLVRCVLTLRSNTVREFVMLEDPIPSNCRIMEREQPAFDEEWSYWWSSTVIRDDRIAFFARRIPNGESVITYTMRAESPGVSSALPPVAENMYDPTQRASDGERRLEVRR